jgi:mono/diheme cytochrome c family protein
MTRRCAAAMVVAACFTPFLLKAVEAHDFGVSITWNREISRLMFDRCASCHRDGGTSFSLMTYQEAQPRAVAIKDAVLSRRMPPWGAVKGFGQFRDDQGLTQEQVELISSWVEGGAQRGNNRRMLPETPTKFELPRGAPVRPPAGSLVAARDLTLDGAFVLDGLLPEHVSATASMKITAVRPDGTVAPLVWLYRYDERFRHVFRLRAPITLPRGTIIRGIQAPARIALLPVGTGVKGQ